MPQRSGPNRQLAVLIEEAGYSHKGLAARVVALGRARGYPGLKYNHSSVQRWLRGECPRAPAADLLAEVFSGAVGRPVTRADLELPAGSPPADGALIMPQDPAGAADVISNLARDDLEHRRPLTTSDFSLHAYSSAALRWLVAPRTALYPGRGGRRVGSADVQEIREAIAAFRVLDNRLGGGRIRPAVVDYLCADIAPLLDEARCTDPVRRELFSAAAELAHLCGWQAHDLELQGLAQRYLVQALALARLAADEALGGEILAAMSQQALYLAQATQAVDMAQVAAATGSRAGLPMLQAESLLMQAHGHALLGDASACSRALRQAETTFSRPTSDPPPWLAYFDEAYFAAKIGHCFRALGQGVQLEQYALRSLDMNPRFIRGKAFNTVLLAAGYALQGELAQACSYGKDAVDLASSLDSARAVAYIRDLLRILTPRQHEPVVSEFTHYARSALPALQPHASRR